MPHLERPTKARVRSTSLCVLFQTKVDDRRTNHAEWHCQLAGRVYPCLERGPRGHTRERQGSEKGGGFLVHGDRPAEFVLGLVDGHLIVLEML